MTCSVENVISLVSCTTGIKNLCKYISAERIFHNDQIENATVSV